MYTGTYLNPGNTSFQKKLNNEIYVDKSIFENIDHTGLDAIFEEVGELIGETRRLCKNRYFG